MIIDGGNSVFKWNTSLKADCFMAIGDSRGKWAGTSNIQLKNFTIIGNILNHLKNTHLNIL